MSSVEAQQTLMLPGAANFVATTAAGIAAGHPRERLLGLAAGVRYGIERDQSTLPPWESTRSGPLQAPWPILRTFAPGPAISRSRCWRVMRSKPAGRAPRCRSPPAQEVKPCRKGIRPRTRPGADGAQCGVAVAAPLATAPNARPRNIPADDRPRRLLLVGIVGTLVVMYGSGVRSLQSGFSR